MLNDPILSILFASRHMDLQLACHLNGVSRQFAHHDQSLLSKVKHVDLRLVCKNYAFQARVLRCLVENLPNLESVRNVKAVGAEAHDILSALSKMPSLTSVHFTYLELSDVTVACLVEFSKLDSLSVDNRLIGTDYKFETFERQLHLEHVKVQDFRVFEQLCCSENLKSLCCDRHGCKIEGLQRFPNLQSLQLQQVCLKYADEIQLLVQEIGTLPSLTSISFDAYAPNWENVQPMTLPDRFLNNLTELKCGNGVFSRAMLSRLTRFPNLRRLEVQAEGFEPQAVFELLPSLRTLVSLHDGQYYSCGPYTTQLNVWSEMNRLILCLSLIVHLYAYSSVYLHHYADAFSCTLNLHG